MGLEEDFAAAAESVKCAAPPNPQAPARSPQPRPRSPALPLIPPRPRIWARGLQGGLRGSGRAARRSPRPPGRARRTLEFSKEPPTEAKLKMYGLFKQANMGDNTASSPWLPGEAKMKWAAWEACKGKTKEEAMTEYIAELERQKVRACPPASLPARPRPALPPAPARPPHPLLNGAGSPPV
eukprot:COSAG04_NODE_3653_length_2637_cov_33.024035_2_plen_182_part_00